MKIKQINIIFTLFIVSLLDNYLKAVFSISIFDDISNFLILTLGIAFFFYKEKNYTLNNNIFIVLFFLYIILLTIFLLDSIPAFTYELYKQLIFMFFIPFVASQNNLSISKLDYKILNFFFYVLLFNSTIILLQYSVNPNITLIFGVSNDYIIRAVGMNRMSGVFENVNIYGDLSLLVYLFNDMVPNKKKHNILKVVAIISVLISTSKHAIVALLLIIIIQNYKLIYKNIAKAIYLIILLIILANFAYFLNKENFDAKIESYSYLLSESNDLNKVDEGKIEVRGQNLLDGIKILKKNNFMGTGLGTWGDFSSTFNENINTNTNLYNRMSDSGIVHIFVEQGYVAFIYLLMLFIPYLSIPKTNKQFFILLLILYGIFSTITMGLTSGSWPIFFAYIYARLLYSKYLPSIQ